MRCLRINERGDRRYRVADLRAFLEVAGIQASPPAHFAPRVRPASTTWAVVDDDRTAASQPSDVAARPGAGPLPARLAAMGPEGGPFDLVSPGPGTARSNGAGLAWRTPPRGEGDIATIARLTDRQWLGRDLDASLRNAARALLGTHRFAMVGIAEWHDGRLVPHLVDGARRARAWWGASTRGWRKSAFEKAA